MGTETDPSNKEAVGAEAPSDLERQIIRQIEYYFGNYNLSRDKFLREQVQIDDGWVPLETMVKFNRLKQLSADFNVIIEALKKSSKQLIEIDDDNSKIRRRNVDKLPEDYKSRQDELDEQTIYVKGFKKNNTLDELLDFFKDYEVEHIFMRRVVKLKGKPFKGSVFVTFESKEGAEKFLSTKGIKYCGVELLKEWKKDYVKRKDEFYQTIREAKEKKIQKKAGLKDGEDENDQVGDTESTADGEDTKGMIRDCLLRLSNLDKSCTRELIKAAFEPLGNIVYVDYHYGMPSAVIRFDTAVASSVLEKMTEEDGQKKIKIDKSDAVVAAIEGEEEEEYWKLISKSRVKSRQANSNKHKFGGNKGSGNRGKFKKWGKRQKGRDKEKDETNDKSPEPPQKKAKMEAGDGDKTSNKSPESPQKKAKREAGDDDKTLNKSPEPPQKKAKAGDEGDKTSAKTEVASSEVKKETPEIKTDS